MRLLLGLLIFLAGIGTSVAQTATVPERSNTNLIVAAYNIQFLGQTSFEHDVEKLAEVIQHFDVCGILEVKSETRVAELAQALRDKSGHDWGYTFGVRTHRPGGNYHEAFAAVWRTDRVSPQGLIGGVWDSDEAFRNDPYLVSFRRDRFDFTLLLLHTRWTNDDEGTRAGEVRELAEQVTWLRSFLSEKDLIVAGDFNYSGTAAQMRAFAEATRMIQVDRNVPSTFKSDFSGYASSYDHIYVSELDTFEYVTDSSDVLDATTLVYGDRSDTSMRASKRELSDHLPVFAVFDVTGPDDD